jgi:hypothetical protein
VARILSAALDACMRSAVRLPAYRIDVYDVRSTALDVDEVKIGDVVRLLAGTGSPLPAIVGPREFTADVVSAALTETAGDYLEGGPTATQLVLTVVDPAGELDPVENPPTDDEPERGGRWLRQGNVVVLYEGDARVDFAEWVLTFVGRLQGQPGRTGGKTTGPPLLTARAASREADFLRQTVTSAAYVQGTPFTSIASDLAETDMGLDADELALPTFSTRATAHAVTQFADESPLTLLAKLMFPDGFMPRFRGDGKLSAVSQSITKGALRSYTDGTFIVSLERPQVDQSGYNEVELYGLDSAASAVTQPRQTLATASITTGFFSRKASIPVRWSDDGTQQALSVRLDVDASVADGIFGFGSERFTAGPADADGGVCRGEITVDGGLEASVSLSILLAGAWLFCHSKPDGVIAFGTGTVNGFTVPAGRLVEGAIGQALMTILGKIGRGQYRITGQPYEMVFKEIPAIARVLGLRDEERSSVRIENQLINTQSDANAIAARVLGALRAQQNARSFVMIHDLALEPHDLFNVGSGAGLRSYVVQSIRRTLSRAGELTAQVDAFETTLGVRP